VGRDDLHQPPVIRREPVGRGRVEREDRDQHVATHPVTRSPFGIDVARSAAAAGPNASATTSRSRAASGRNQPPLAPGIRSARSADPSARTSATDASPAAARARLTNASRLADGGSAASATTPRGGSISWRDW
jgi:hypothetical protein